MDQLRAPNEDATLLAMEDGFLQHGAPCEPLIDILSGWKFSSPTAFNFLVENR